MPSDFGVKNPNPSVNFCSICELVCGSFTFFRALLTSKCPLTVTVLTVTLRARWLLGHQPSLRVCSLINNFKKVGNTLELLIIVYPHFQCRVIDHVRSQSF